MPLVKALNLLIRIFAVLAFGVFSANANDKKNLSDAEFCDPVLKAMFDEDNRLNISLGARMKSTVYHTFVDMLKPSEIIPESLIDEPHTFDSMMKAPFQNPVLLDKLQRYNQRQYFLSPNGKWAISTIIPSSNLPQKIVSIDMQNEKANIFESSQYVHSPVLPLHRGSLNSALTNHLYVLFEMQSNNLHIWNISNGEKLSFVPFASTLSQLMIGFYKNYSYPTTKQLVVSPSGRFAVIFMDHLAVIINFVNGRIDAITERNVLAPKENPHGEPTFSSDETQIRFETKKEALIVDLRHLGFFERVKKAQ